MIYVGSIIKRAGGRHYNAILLNNRAGLELYLSPRYAITVRNTSDGKVTQRLEFDFLDTALTKFKQFCQFYGMIYAGGPHVPEPVPTKIETLRQWVKKGRPVSFELPRGTINGILADHDVQPGDYVLELDNNSWLAFSPDDVEVSTVDHTITPLRKWIYDEGMVYVVVSDLPNANARVDSVWTEEESADKRVDELVADELTRVKRKWGELQTEQIEEIKTSFYALPFTLNDGELCT